MRFGRPLWFRRPLRLFQILRTVGECLLVRDLDSLPRFLAVAVDDDRFQDFEGAHTIRSLPS